MCAALKEHIENVYNISVDKITMVRDMIGTIYAIEDTMNTYYFKLFKTHQKTEAITSIDVMNHLYQEGVHTPKIIKTKDKNLCTQYNGRIAVLKPYIDGNHPSRTEDIKQILQTHQTLLDAMQNYQYPIPPKGMSYYIGRYLRHLEKIGYTAQKVDHLRKIGNTLFNQVDLLPKGFCHGDYHTGNMVKRNDFIYIFDFDACTILSPYIDYATILDLTNFNTLNKDDFLKTREQINLFHQDTPLYVKAMMAFIPIRHYEIIATIIEAKGHEDIGIAFYDEQYIWIRSFYDYWQAYYN